MASTLLGDLFLEIVKQLQKKFLCDLKKKFFWDALVQYRLLVPHPLDVRISVLCIAPLYTQCIIK